MVDIAGALGLSVNAVSKALRDAPDISEATKSRVRKEALRVGYVPDAAAIRLRTGKGGGMGFLVPDLGGPGVIEILRGVERAAARATLPVVVVSGGAGVEGEWAAFRRLLGQQVGRAVIMGGPGMGQRSALLREAALRGVPLVYVNQFPAAAPQYTNVSRVSADWRGAGRLAVEAVASCGHRRIGYLAGRVSGSAWAEHFQGVMAAVEDREVSLIHTIFSDPGLEEAGAVAARELLAGRGGITAIVCAGDRMACGVWRVLEEAGCRDRVAVVGCGGLERGLATVRVPWERLGERAAEMLLTGGWGREERLGVEWQDGASLFRVG